MAGFHVAVDNAMASERAENTGGWTDDTTPYLQKPLLRQLRSATDTPLEEQRMRHLLE